MGQRKYSPERETELVARLWHSAIRRAEDGAWVPQFRAIGREEGVNYQTLKDMWDRQPEENRLAMSDSVTRARGRIAEDTFVFDMREFRETALAGLRWCIDSKRTEPLLGESTDRHGATREYVIVNGLRADQRTRAIGDAVPLAVSLAKDLGLTVEEALEPDSVTSLDTPEGRSELASQIATLPPEVLEEALRRQQGHTEEPEDG